MGPEGARRPTCCGGDEKVFAEEIELQILFRKQILNLVLELSNDMIFIIRDC
jgi:hypothetical protein